MNRQVLYWENRDVSTSHAFTQKPWIQFSQPSGRFDTLLLQPLFSFGTFVSHNEIIYQSTESTRMAPGGPTGLALSEFEVLMLTEVRFGNVVDCLALRTNRPNPNRQDLRGSMLGFYLMRSLRNSLVLDFFFAGTIIFVIGHDLNGFFCESL